MTSSKLTTDAPKPTWFSLKAASEVLSDFGRPLTFLILGLVVLGACLGTYLVVGTVPFEIIIGALLAGFAGIVTFGLFAFSADEKAKSALSFKPLELVEALNEAACIAGPDGYVYAANKAWIDAGGSSRRLPKGNEAPALFVGMVEARTKSQGRAFVRLGDFDFEMVISPLSEELLLIRAASQAVLGTGFMLETEEPKPDDALLGDSFLEPEAVKISAMLSGPNTIDAPKEASSPITAVTEWASAPFGVALILGTDVLNDVCQVSNSAFDALAKPPQKDFALKDVLTEQSRQDLNVRLDSDFKGPIDVCFKTDPSRTYGLHITPLNDGLRLYVFDITEHKKLEQTLAQSQKMQAMGQFAGGIAHDFNNLLTGFKLRNDQLLQMHPLGDPSYEDLNGIRQIIARAEDLVRNLLAYARKQTVKRVTINAGELISEAEVLLRRLVREDIKLVTDYGRNLPDVHVDKGQMEMVLMNLVVNARDAMKQMGGGTVMIKTSRLSQAEAIKRGYSEAPSLGAALIDVTDTGTGIPQEILDRVFEPFFTTKPQGEGTGLGLSTVFGIITQAGGHVIVESPPGKGAHFQLFLPAWVDKEKPQTAKKIEAKPVPKDLSGSGRILFVEDEQIVRGLAAKLLRQRGYEVIEACDGEEALLIIEEENGRFDLLISDVIMPGLDGPSMLKKARPIIGNHVPVMFISGYAESEFSDLLEAEANVSFLPKPLDIKTLAERVKEQLAA